MRHFGMESRRKNKKPATSLMMAIGNRSLVRAYEETSSRETHYFISLLQLLYGESSSIDGPPRL